MTTKNIVQYPTSLRSPLRRNP